MTSTATRAVVDQIHSVERRTGNITFKDQVHEDFYARTREIFAIRSTVCIVTVWEERYAENKTSGDDKRFEVVQEVT